MKKERILMLFLVLLFLGVRDGYIALWKEDRDEVLNRYPYKADYLPGPDRRALERGIPVKDHRQLAQLLEDYLS